MINLEVIRVKWEPGKELLQDLPEIHRNAFEDFIAQRYVDLIKERVKTQKFRTKWKPLSPRYLDEKRLLGLSLNTWEATGQLMKELRVKKGRVVGFDNRKTHKASKERLLSIARRNEYGSFLVPARPLFRPVYWYMRKNISFFYDEFRRSLV